MWYNFTLHNRWSGIVALHCSRKVGFVKRVGSFNAMQETAKSKNPTKKGKGQRETVFQMQYNYELCNRCTRRKSSFVITQKSAKSLGFQFIVSEAEFLNEADGEICTAVVATWSGYHLCRCLSRKSHMKSKKVLKWCQWYEEEKSTTIWPPPSWNIARIVNAVQYHSKLLRNKDCHEFKISIVRILNSVSLLWNLWEALWLSMW